MKKSINYWSFKRQHPIEAMKIAKDAGYDGIELTIDTSTGLTPDTSVDELHLIREKAEKINLAIPSVACSIHWQYSLVSDDPSERQQAYEIVVKQIKFASILGSETILLVPGNVANIFVPDSPVVDYEKCWTRALSALDLLKHVAEEHDVQIGVENVWNKFLLSPLEFKHFLDEVNSEYVGMYFDVGNVIASGFPEQWIRILGKYLQKVHFKDFRSDPGGLNCFVDLLAGDVNWPAVMQALQDVNYDGWVTAEMTPYQYASDQIIYNTAVSMDRIINQDF
ncbi:MAG: sugar phosphate isomerase/epimerase [Clostridiaceae bacterium]|nr:sugar phosphate isomerase/epimerase [Clostridiaceae bacterium]